MDKTSVTDTTRSRQGRPKTIVGLLLSALDMEDEIAHSVYKDYLERSNWPSNLKDDIFEQIREMLTTLLKDTERHHNIVTHLKSKLENDNG
ncbi:MAG: hypothetical protein JXA82_08320 [Sedimentisphaerales bacterium]|nr:hypothetical protein [Sedimentisphaerales bacterium]